MNLDRPRHRFQPGGARMFAVAVLALAALLGGCGGDDSGASVTVGARTPSGGAPATATPAPVTAVASASPSPGPTTARAVSGSAYVVKSGDTLWDLAQEWGVTTEAIVAANSLASPDDLVIGQEIKIP